MPAEVGDSLDRKLNCPGIHEGRVVQARLLRGGLAGEMLVVVCISFCRGDVSDGANQLVMDEPGHPLQRCQLHQFAGGPGEAMNHFGLVQPIYGLGQGVVVAVALAAH